MKKSNLRYKPFITIFGPTASGKSNMALCLAKHLSAPIINADSCQIFRECPILSAAPSPEDLNTAPHELYGIRSWASGPSNAAEWATIAAELISKHIANTSPILVGGTGFYIKTLTEGVCPVPPVASFWTSILPKILRFSSARAILFKLLNHIQPEHTIHLHNTHALIRALSVFFSSGRSLTFWHKKQNLSFTPYRNFNIKLLPSKEELDETISARAHKMLSEGVLKEVEGSPIDIPIIGFQTLKKYLNKTISYDEALQLLIIETRQYAKRQITFSKRLKHHMLWPHSFRSTFSEDFLKVFDKEFAGAVGEN